MALSDGPKASSVWQQLQWIMRPFSFMRACQRQLLLPPFHGERMRSYGELMREITEQVMTEYPPGQPFAARQLMQNISLRVILRAVFGLNEGTRCQRIE
jgi:cytochrome P450 family 110